MRASRSTISVSTLQLLQSRGDAKAGLSAADHQHGRIAIGIVGGGFPQVEPVGPAKIARIGLPRGRAMPSCSSKPFSSSSAVSSVHAFRRLPSAASGIRRTMPLPRPIAVSNLKIASIEARAGTRHLAWRGAVGIDREAAGAASAGMRLQRLAGWRRAPLMVWSVQLSASTSRQ